jgi:transposase
LVDSHGFAGRYASVKRFVRRLRGQPAKSACAVIVTPPAEEAQGGQYRRTRLFVFTLGYSRKAVRLLTFQSSTRIWTELHEQAFRRLGGACRTIVLDNLSEGVLKPDIYDPALNPLYRDMLTTAPSRCLVASPIRIGRGKSSAASDTPRTHP